MPGGNVSDPAVKNVDMAQPTVVRIITGLVGHLDVHFSSTNNIMFPQANSDIYQVSLSGTGTFIDSQGDILTADHVVNPPENSDMTSQLYQMAAPDIAAYMNSNATNGGSQVTQQQVVQQLTSGQLKSTATYDTPRSTVYLSTAYTGLTKATSTQNLPPGVAVNVDQIKKQSPVNQEDTAIIHVPLTDTLSVPLGNSANVQEQDKLTIIGFPGNADVSQTPDSLLTSSVNQIYVSSSKKTSSTGAPLIQVTGNVEHGDSGGPALDSQGKIVGIVSFGVLSQSGPSSTSFLQASSSAQSMLQNLKINTTPGSQQKLWTQALNDYASIAPGHWHKAQQDFAQLQKSYPNFKAIQPYYAYAQSQAKNEATIPGAQATPTPTSNTVPAPHATNQPVTWQGVTLTIGSIVILVVLASGLVGVSLRPRKRKDQPDQPQITSGSGQDKTASKPPLPQPSPTTTAGNTPAPATSQDTLSLKVWPCGHMNRPNARFCNICGEPAPSSPSQV
jgi:hypothetical protein